MFRWVQFFLLFFFFFVLLKYFLLITNILFYWISLSNNFGIQKLIIFYFLQIVKVTFWAPFIMFCWVLFCYIIFDQILVDTLIRKIEPQTRDELMDNTRYQSFLRIWTGIRDKIKFSGLRFEAERSAIERSAISFDKIFRWNDENW